MDPLPLTRESFPNLTPIVTPQPFSRLPERVWTAAEWDRIRLGHRAGGMDEKWDVLTEGDVVFMHRSWTGRGIYEVTFSPVADGGRRMTSAVVEANSESRRRRSEDFDRLAIEIIISMFVLGEPADELWAAFRDLTASRSGVDVDQQALKHRLLGTREAK